MRCTFNLIFGSVVLLGMLGCGSSGPPTHEIKGKVTFDGETIKEGVVFFESSDPKTPKVNTSISDGVYKAELPAGKYAVRITAMKMAKYPPGKVGASGEKEGPQQFLPPKFNEKSTLTADISGPRELDFALTSK